jgi:hypothetical protein
MSVADSVSASNVNLDHPTKGSERFYGMFRRDEAGKQLCGDEYATMSKDEYPLILSGCMA